MSVPLYKKVLDNRKIPRKKSLRKDLTGLLVFSKRFPPTKKMRPSSLAKCAERRGKLKPRYPPDEKEIGFSVSLL